MMIIVIFKIYILQGSVATRLRRGGIFSNHFITNFPQNVLVKNIGKSVDIWRRYNYFLGHPVWFNVAFLATQKSGDFIIDLNQGRINH